MRADWMPSGSPERKPRERVLLFWPVFGTVEAAAFQNFLRLVASAVRNCPDYEFDPWVYPRSSVHGAMNQAVEIALQNNHKYLIAFDDDCLPELHQFPVGNPARYQVIPRLLGLGDQRGHKVVMGVGYMRGYPHTTTIGRKFPFGQALIMDSDETSTVKGFHWLDDLSKYDKDLDADGLLDVDFCGVPVVMIHRDVLQKVEKPLFETHDPLTGATSTHDIYFCNKAKEAGFAIRVDTHIDCGHIIAPPIVNRYTKAELQRALKGLN